MSSSILSRKRRRLTSSPSPPIRAQIPKLGDIAPALPMTPPDPDGPSGSPVNALSASISTAIHVISTERAGLAHLERIYLTDKLARDNMERAVTTVASTVSSGGKLVISGVGKSGKIGEKVVATMNSLGVQSTFLHPTEALHGDLGMVKPNDTVLLITFSGKTPELLRLLPHLPATVTLIAITAHMQPSLCPLLTSSNCTDSILLAAPVHEHEEISFGLPAPMTSTTVALALGDALALAVSRKLHTLPGKGPAEVFRGFHPGGAIGAASRASMTPVSEPASGSTPGSSLFSDDLLAERGSQMVPAIPPNDGPYVSDIGTPFDLIPCLPTHSSQDPAEIKIIDVLRAAIRSPSAEPWVSLSPTAIIPPSQVRALAEEADVDIKLKDLPNAAGVIVHRKDWFQVPKYSTVSDVKRMSTETNEDDHGHSTTRAGTRSTMRPVVAVTDAVTGDVISVLEGKELLNYIS